jgi:hypothetical protein
MAFEGLKTSIQQRICALVLGALAISLFPVRTEKTVMKNFSRGLSIQTSKREPPRIAFSEAMNFSKVQRYPQIPNTPSINLNDKVEQRFLDRTVTLIRAQKVSLPELRISRSEILSELRENALRDQQAMDARLASKDLETEWIEKLPAYQRTRILLAQENSKVLDQDWQDPISSGTSDSQPNLQRLREPQNETPRGQRVIAGGILLQQGLGLGDGYIDVRYVKDRIAQAAGQVEAPKGKYSIQIPENSGFIKATLYSRQGQALGEGRIKVSQVKSNDARTSIIAISPMQNSFAVSHYDFDKSLTASAKSKDYGDRGLRGETYVASLDTEVDADEQGVSRIENVVRDSWALVRTEASGYSPGLSLVGAGPEKRKPLFRQKFTQALLSVAKEQQKSSIVEETGSVVWGQVHMDGKPQEGVQIDIEFGEDYKAIYFNQFLIPDTGLKATSANGYFAILHLPEGFHSLVATRGGKYFSHANVQAEPGSVFATEIEGTLRTAKAEVKVFNAFSGATEQAQLEIQSLEESIEVDGNSDVYLPEIERLSLMKVTPSAPTYVSQIQVYSDVEDSLQVPLVESSWLQGLRAARRLVNEPNTSIVVGFVVDEDFEAYLPHAQDYNAQNLIYFDSKGQIAATGKAGGGFVMFNVLPGTHSVVTVAKSTNAVNTQVVPVDLGIASVLQFHY